MLIFIIDQTELFLWKTWVCSLITAHKGWSSKVWNRSLKCEGKLGARQAEPPNKSHMKGIQGNINDQPRCLAAWHWAWLHWLHSGQRTSAALFQEEVVVLYVPRRSRYDVVLPGAVRRLDKSLNCNLSSEVSLGCWKGAWWEKCPRSMTRKNR